MKKIKQRDCVTGGSVYTCLPLMRRISPQSSLFCYFCPTPSVKLFPHALHISNHDRNLWRRLDKHQWVSWESKRHLLRFPDICRFKVIQRALSSRKSCPDHILTSKSKVNVFYKKKSLPFHIKISYFMTLCFIHYIFTPFIIKWLKLKIGYFSCNKLRQFK